MKFYSIGSIFLVSITLLAIGCVSTQQFTQAQLNAIETREVEASMNETYNAASGAMFDAGYTIAMSDRQGGLLTGTKAVDRSAERYWISHYIEDTKFTVSIQVRETTPKNCTVRVKTSINGAPKVDKKAIDELWILMQRQVLMKEPLLEEPPDKILSPQKNLLPYSPPKSQKDTQISTEKESTIDKTSRKEIANGSSELREEPQFIGVCAQCGRHIGKNEKICMLGSKILCTECFKKTSENR
jgi:RNA polymerase-binding transcription factor DksA